jgi:hypothetical protein
VAIVRTAEILAPKRCALPAGPIDPHQLERLDVHALRLDRHVGAVDYPEPQPVPLDHDALESFGRSVDHDRERRPRIVWYGEELVCHRRPERHVAPLDTCIAGKPGPGAGVVDYKSGP